MTSILGPEWHLSANGIDMITENGNIKEYKKVLDNALNTDLKEIGSAVLTSELSKDKTSKIVLQIQKIRNISAPKANEESHAAPRMLKLNLTDGDTHIQALEIATINSISRSYTPPGTKLLISNAKIISGYILLNANNCTVLGGKVPHLLEKWEIAKSIQRSKRGNSSGEDGPPPWVSFGMKILSGNQDGTFKSLGNKNKEGNKDSSEFELQRQGAIAEASGAVRKVFGGRVKQNVQPTSNIQNRQFENGRERQERGKNRFKSAPRERDIEDKPSKPSEKVSLFAFLEDKLPLSDNQNTAKSTSYSYSESQIYPKNQMNTNKNFDSQVKPYNNPQKGYQNYNQQTKRDYKQGSYNKNENIAGQYNKYEKNYSQPTLGQFNSPKHFEKPQSNDYLKQSDKPNNLYSNNLSNNTSVRPYERPQQQIKKNDNPATTSKPPQINNNIQKDVNDLANNVNKISLNSQFASRSLRQHLNLGPPKKNEENFKKHEEPQNTVWDIGDECLAKYWEDGKFYNAIVTAVTDKTYAVRFKGYGNIEEILKTDCLPVTSNKQNYGGQNQQNRKYDQNNKPYSGSMEFRRSTRNFK